MFPPPVPPHVFAIYLLSKLGHLCRQAVSVFPTYFLGTVLDELATSDAVREPVALAWDRAEQLAAAAGFHVYTPRSFETPLADQRQTVTLDGFQRALEAAGIEFIPGGGAPSRAAGGGAGVLSEAMIDSLVAGGLTRTQAYAVFRLGADVHCHRVFDRAIASRDLVGSGFSAEHAEGAIDRAIAALSREHAGPAREGRGTKRRDRRPAGPRPPGGRRALRRAGPNLHAPARGRRGGPVRPAAGPRPAPRRELRPGPGRGPDRRPAAAARDAAGRDGP